MENNQLIQVIQTSGVEQSTATTLETAFMPFFQQANEWKKQAESLTVTDVSQTENMIKARKARLALKDIRVSADKKRKELKEDSLRYGKAVQGVYNVIEYLIVPLENFLQEQEDFAKIQKLKEQAELKARREMDINIYSEFIPAGLDFGIMTDADFEKLLSGAKLQYQFKIEQEQKAEQEQIEKAEREKATQERIRFENEKLRAEALERERLLLAENAKIEAERKAEREKAEQERKAIEEKARAEQAAAAAKLQAEREERAKIEAELKAKADAERKAIEEKARAEKKASQAPDKQKLETLAKDLENFQYPELKSFDIGAILNNVKYMMNNIVSYIEKEISKI